MTSALAMHEPVEDSGWIGNRRFDLVFFFGSALVAVFVGAFALAVPVAVIPLFWAFLVFVEGPHLVATWARTYLDAQERQRRRQLLLGSFAWLLPGLLAWSAARLFHSRAPIDLFLLFATPLELSSRHSSILRHSHHLSASRPKLSSGAHV